ncbi:putative acetyltransferase, GNAT [Ktedonobacter sp. SOSP1-85]|uniref:GNAT family N-acetyltransferase n=1 Tax=Ktedonobacter sp. SOSP1-85 TaxID=2778367 RepID=UPI001914F360|nr:GNAT family N-acetyltransferase [Ktedonobacter sp. SOSP1-85]GHO76290.1 putative acetyltransferase, GNAT [Ktedonobacter sp. SOSP1-85]
MDVSTLPAGISVRPASLDDIQALVALFEARDRELGIEPERTAENLKRDFTKPHVDLQRDSLVALTSMGELVSYAWVEDQQHVHIFMNLETRADYRESGLADAMLEWAETRAREYIAQAPEGLRVTLRNGCDVHYVSRRHLLERHGFQVVRHFYDMKIELAEPLRQPVWPDGIRVQNTQPGMERAIFEANNEAFRDHWGFVENSFENWSHYALDPHTFDPTLWFLAMDGEEIAGFAICGKEGDDKGWVYDLAVRRPWRRKGIAQALLHEAFNAFYQRGIHNVLLGVDASSLTGALRVYERVGMHAVREFLAYRKELRPGKESGTEELA